MASGRPLLAAIDMGYGHLRAASALATALDVPVHCVDEPPLADDDEQRLWARARWMYEFVSRASQLPVIGGPFDFALGAMTQIPDLYPIRDLSAPTLPVRYLARQARRGLGRGLVEHLRAEDQPLLTTFYAPAVLADIAGVDRVFCVVTDADVNRIWVPPDVNRSRIHYLVPGTRTARRLRSYGVRAAQISLTGFPLPPELLGGRDLPTLKANLAARLARLDPRGAFLEDFRDEVNHFLPGAMFMSGQALRPPLITFAVGGAGAQAGLPRRFLPAFRRPLEDGRLRLALVAGVRAEVAAIFEQTLADVGMSDLIGGPITILRAAEMPEYFRRFNALLAETDVLWTKPSELTFFAALGLPLVFAPPVGQHESYNLRWAREAGAGVKQRAPDSMAERLLDWLEDGTLAGAAWSGYMRLPKFGTYRISDLVKQNQGVPAPGYPPVAVATELSR
jgi:hypothetical protein